MKLWATTFVLRFVSPLCLVGAALGWTSGLPNWVVGFQPQKPRESFRDNTTMPSKVVQVGSRIAYILGAGCVGVTLGE